MKFISKINETLLSQAVQNQNTEIVKKILSKANIDINMKLICKYFSYLV